ncbi:hypothetical protein MHK_003879 [Candidatus Magnetomorum sp. HK-1]|nr:hypothetical protein MHK_003879 [Candidatus Magnetomorum sp. HK-1]
MLPNERRDNNYFKANQVYQIPDFQDGFQLLVGEPYGKEKMVIYASPTPLGDIKKIKTSTGLFYNWDGTKKELSRKVRSINVVPIDGVDFYEGTWTVKTHE